MATFLRHINMVSRSANLFLEQALAGRCGIKGHQAKYLLSLDHHPEISQDALARMLFVNKSNVARQVSALEEAGYVVRREDPADRRVSLLSLTDRAAEVLPKIRAANAKWREIITEGFSEEERAELLRLTERLYANALAYLEGGR